MTNATSRFKQPTGPRVPIETESARSSLRAVSHSEWHKLRTTRSTFWTLLIAGGVSIALGALHCLSIRGMHGREAIDAVGASVFGVSLSQFVMAVAGVLAITNEYSSGTILPTLTATPRRNRLILAKVVVIGSVALLYGSIIAFGSFVIGQTILPTYLHVALLDWTTLRRILGAAVVFSAMAVIGLALGLITRRTAGGIVALVVVLLLPTALLDPLSATVRQQAIGYLPLRAADALVAARPEPHGLAPAAALGVLALEIVALLAIGGLLFCKRDA